MMRGHGGLLDAAVLGPRMPYASAKLEREMMRWSKSRQQMIHTWGKICRGRGHNVGRSHAFARPGTDNHVHFLGDGDPHERALGSRRDVLEHDGRCKAPCRRCCRVAQCVRVR